MIQNLDKHFMLTSAAEVARICAPLKKFDTTYLNFVRRYEDGSEICLTTDEKWTKYFYTNQLYTKVKVDRIFVENGYLANKIKFIPWTQFSDSPILEIQRRDFGVGIGASLIFIHKGYADFFHFGTRNENQHMISVYANFSDCLFQFTHYFYDKAAEIIQTASRKENLIYLPDRISYKQTTPAANPNCHLNIKEFVKDTIPKHFLIHLPDGGVYLTKQEVRCLSLFTFGKTAPEIGEMLHISTRTVETHVQNLKQKLGLSSGAKKADIIKTVFDAGFDLQRLLPSDQI